MGFKCGHILGNNTHEENCANLERQRKFLEKQARLTLAKRDFYQKLDEENFERTKRRYDEEKRKAEQQEKGDFRIQCVFDERTRKKSSKPDCEPAAEQTVEQIVVHRYSVADEIREFKDLFDDGIITEEEFKAKKKQLLGL